MTLSLAGKNPVKFEWAAGNMTAAFVIAPDADQEDILAAMEEVISFVRTQQAKAAGRPPTLMERYGQVEITTKTVPTTFPVGKGHPDYAPEPPAVAPGNGWAAVVPVEKPALPERLMGEVELIEGEE